MRWASWRGLIQRQKGEAIPAIASNLAKQSQEVICFQPNEDFSASNKAKSLSHSWMLKEPLPRGGEIVRDQLGDLTAHSVVISGSHPDLTPMLPMYSARN